MSWGTVELEAEVRDWLEALPTDLFARAAFYVDLLAQQGPLLGEPYTKQIEGKLRELRFWLDRDAMRITYWIASDRRIVLAPRSDNRVLITERRPSILDSLVPVFRITFRP